MFPVADRSTAATRSLTLVNTDSESFPRLAARTRRFSLGAPRNLSICADGRRLLFLRSASGDDARTGLWAIDLPDGEERVVVGAAADERPAGRGADAS